MAEQQGNQAGDTQRVRDYLAVRERTLALVAPLSAEDMVVQSMPDASPAKWHLGHTSWFFETFLLQGQPHYRPFDPDFPYLFNSYYEALGPRQPRPQRGLLTRPGLERVLAYRRHVDRHMVELLQAGADDDALGLLALGLAHEEQHQELLLMDLLHLFSCSPLAPAYDDNWPALPGSGPGRFRIRPGGLVEIGQELDTGFHFDNEGPRHRIWLQPFEISERLVTNGQWLAFMEDGGYRRVGLWLADGWALVQEQRWQAPLYWRQGNDGSWWEFGLGGLKPLDPEAPVSHVSYYEADAFACWAGARLPTEAEWEMAAVDAVLEQQQDCAWQWTASAYLPYPGFRAAAGAVGEYNGKFMSGQMVLRGGSQLTPGGHSRPSYRNFFQPDQRWVKAGVRLARDVSQACAGQLDSDFALDVVKGLSAAVKALPPKYFYDATGSRLFEEICRLPEYYLTRSESRLLGQIAPALMAEVPEGTVLVEFGSGASDKTRLLLEAGPGLDTYVPIDISEDALQGAAERLRRRYPGLTVMPIKGDFTQPLALPASLGQRARIGFFPGSTIGNFDPGQARRLLSGMRGLLGPEARLIIGVDMVKEEQVLLDAYDDSQGVTTAFNKNLLGRINRELLGNFNPAAFDHLALWNGKESRVEMHLVSRQDQIVQMAGHSFRFRSGERLHTENSYKFTPASFSALAAAAGWQVERHWLSEAPQFGIFVLT
ncbi:ergothioneine biosynthesis protein EgtB [Gallaecimonas sp. GXIMD4217]|uniref:ergothioneine biosynthesis protein EgtB n=1 Tax=Gallaecimonas sp. GXIMD4217 TaxID=3131927 RepID=UPI00311B084C